MVPKLSADSTSKILRYSKPHLAACAIFETKVSSSPDVQAERFLFESVEPEGLLGLHELIVTTATVRSTDPVR